MRNTAPFTVWSSIASRYKLLPVLFKLTFALRARARLLSNRPLSKFVWPVKRYFPNVCCLESLLSVPRFVHFLVYCYEDTRSCYFHIQGGKTWPHNVHTIWSQSSYFINLLVFWFGHPRLNVSQLLSLFHDVTQRKHRYAVGKCACISNLSSLRFRTSQKCARVTVDMVTGMTHWPSLCRHSFSLYFRWTCLKVHRLQQLSQCRVRLAQFRWRMMLPCAEYATIPAGIKTGRKPYGGFAGVKEPWERYTSHVWRGGWLLCIVTDAPFVIISFKQGGSINRLGRYVLNLCPFIVEMRNC